MANRTKLTAEKKEDFIALLEKHGSVTEVCGLLGISRMCAYAHRAEDESFRDSWDAAIKLGEQSLLDAAHERAIGGSDTLLIFLLKGAFPERFRERRETIAQMTHQGPGGQPLAMQAVVNVTIAAPDEDRDPSEP